MKRLMLMFALLMACGPVEQGTITIDTQGRGLSVDTQRLELQLNVGSNNCLVLLFSKQMGASGPKTAETLVVDGKLLEPLELFGITPGAHSVVVWGYDVEGNIIEWGCHNGGAAVEFNTGERVDLTISMMPLPL